MLAAATYFHHAGIFCILAVLAAILGIAFNPAITRRVCALPCICHNHLALPNQLLLLLIVFDAKTPGLGGQVAACPKVAN
jgi:hypothetical protein